MPTDDREIVKQRECLRCHKLFKSTGAGNRICVLCKNKGVDGGGRMVTLTELEGTIGRRGADG